MDARLRSVGEDGEFTCRWLIGRAGLKAPALLSRIPGFPADALHTLCDANGNYFVCQRRRPFTHLVYSMPKDGALQPAYAGVRPKSVGPAETVVDGLTNLLGIESPGITASLAIVELLSMQMQHLTSFEKQL